MLTFEYEFELFFWNKKVKCGLKLSCTIVATSVTVGVPCCWAVRLVYGLLVGIIQWRIYGRRDIRIDHLELFFSYTYLLISDRPFFVTYYLCLCFISTKRTENDRWQIHQHIFLTFLMPWLISASVATFYSTPDHSPYSSFEKINFIHLCVMTIQYLRQISRNDGLGMRGGIEIHDNRMSSDTYIPPPRQDIEYTTVALITGWADWTGPIRVTCESGVTNTMGRGDKFLHPPYTFFMRVTR